MLKRNCHICKPWDSLFFLKPFCFLHKKYKNRFFIKKITVSQEFRLPWIVKLAFWSPAARCILSLKAIKVRERATVSDIWNIIAWNVHCSKRVNMVRKAKTAEQIWLWIYCNVISIYMRIYEIQLVYRSNNLWSH